MKVRRANREFMIALLFARAKVFRPQIFGLVRRGRKRAADDCGRLILNPVPNVSGMYPDFEGAGVMRVVITGAAGFVGQKLAAALAKAGSLGGERIAELALFD